MCNSEHGTHFHTVPDCCCTWYRVVISNCYIDLKNSLFWLVDRCPLKWSLKHSSSQQFTPCSCCKPFNSHHWKWKVFSAPLWWIFYSSMICWEDSQYCLSLSMRILWSDNMTYCSDGHSLPISVSPPPQNYTDIWGKCCRIAENNTKIPAIYLFWISLFNDGLNAEVKLFCVWKYWPIK